MPTALLTALSGTFRVDEISKIVMRSQYVNLFKLLREHVNVETYLMIVRNKARVGTGHVARCAVGVEPMLRRRTKAMTPPVG